jgi:hypothetical protein
MAKCRRLGETMPVTWAAFHSTRLVTITLRGVITREDFDDYLDGVLTPATLSYRKLVDLTEGSVALSAAEIAGFTARVHEHSRAGTMGAVALAVRPNAQKQLALLIESLSSAADRPLKVFGDLRTARDWLDTPSPDRRRSDK